MGLIPSQGDRDLQKEGMCPAFVKKETSLEPKSGRRKGSVILRTSLHEKQHELADHSVVGALVHHVSSQPLRCARCFCCLPTAPAPVPWALGNYAPQNPPPAGFWETQVRGCSTDGGGSIVYGCVKVLAEGRDLGWAVVTGSHLRCA